MTAANVAYQWSHDLMGPAEDHELTVRWMQWGAFSSFFRIHDRGMSAGNTNKASDVNQPCHTMRC